MLVGYIQCLIKFGLRKDKKKKSRIGSFHGLTFTILSRSTTEHVPMVLVIALQAGFRAGMRTRQRGYWPVKSENKTGLGLVGLVTWAISLARPGPSVWRWLMLLPLPSKWTIILSNADFMRYLLHLQPVGICVESTEWQGPAVLNGD